MSYHLVSYKILKIQDLAGKILKFLNFAGKILNFPNFAGKILNFPNLAGKMLNFPNRTGKILNFQTDVTSHNYLFVLYEFNFSLLSSYTNLSGQFKSVSKFLGVSFAAPPTGEVRFKAP